MILSQSASDNHNKTFSLSTRVATNSTTTTIHQYLFVTLISFARPHSSN